MKKKVLTIAFIMAIVVFVPAFAFADEEDLPTSGTFDGVDWRITEDQELIIGAEGETQEFTYRAEPRVFPWSKAFLTSIRFEGKVIGNGNMNGMFQFEYGFVKASSHDYYGKIEYSYALVLKKIDLTGFDTSKVTSMNEMFKGCVSLEELDLTGFDTSKVTSMNNMFEGCASLEKLDLTGLDTSHVASMDQMFIHCGRLKELDLGDFDTSQVTSMESMFEACYELNELDLSNFDTSHVTSMYHMFMFCGFTKIDLSSFNTSNVVDMGGMFFCCSRLKELDLSGFDTCKVEYMGGMFSLCDSLESLDISSFDTESATGVYFGIDFNMYEYVIGCPSLTYIALGPKTRVIDQLAFDPDTGIYNENTPNEWIRYKSLSGQETSAPRYKTLTVYDGKYPGWYKITPRIVTPSKKTVKRKVYDQNTIKRIVYDKKLAGTKISSIKAGKKAMTIKWKKLSKKKQKTCAGIEIRYSLKKSFPTRMTATKTVRKTAKKIKVTKLKSKKTYYVKIRTIKTVKGVKHVGKWSKVKKVKIK